MAKKTAKKTAKKQGPKTRLASERDREAAAYWSAVYREQIPCVQVGISDDGLVPLDGDYLAKLLDDFADAGTFCPPLPNVNLWPVREAFEKMRKDGMRVRAAHAQLSIDFGVSETTIARHLRRLR